MGVIFQFSQPNGSRGIARHTQVASGRQRNLGDFGAIGHTGALELLREETAQEYFESVFDCGGMVHALEGSLCQTEHLFRRCTTQ